MDQDFLERLFNEKFAGMTQSMNLQHEIVQVTLCAIGKQTDKVETELKEISKSLQEVKNNESRYYSEFLLVKDFSEFKKKYYETEKKREEQDKDLNFYVRNPKLTFAGIVIAVLIMLFGSSEYQEYKNKTDKQAIQTNANNINSIENTIEAKSQLK